MTPEELGADVYREMVTAHGPIIAAAAAIRAAVAQEREACAMVAINLQDEPIAIRDPSPEQWDLAAVIRDAIRARSITLPADFPP